MTLIVRLDLSPDQEAQLRDGIVHHDTERIRQVLTEALTPAVETLLHQELEQPDEDEFEAVADQLAGLVAATVSDETPILTAEAVSRAGIYEDHP
jgi:hypothetical protein